MSIDLRTFRTITGGFARGCHFNLGIFDNRAFGSSRIISYGTGIITAPLMTAFCSSMTLPSKSIQNHEVAIQEGIPPIKFARDISYDTWTVTFYSDQLLLLRAMFLKWMEQVNNTKNKKFNVPSVYKSQNAVACILSPNNLPVHAYGFRGLYPIDVQGVSVSQQDSEVLQFSVTFSYDFFTVNRFADIAKAFALEVGTGFILGKLFGGGGGGPRDKTISLPYGLKFKLPIPI